MTRQRLRMALRLRTVASFRQTIARQALVSANRALSAAAEDLREAENALVWLETRRRQEVAAESADISVIKSLDAARDLAGDAWEQRSRVRDECRALVEWKTAEWTDARRRESGFDDHYERALGESHAAQSRIEAASAIEAWIAGLGAPR